MYKVIFYTNKDNGIRGSSFYYNNDGQSSSSGSWFQVNIISVPGYGTVPLLFV